MNKQEYIEAYKRSMEFYGNEVLSIEITDDGEVNATVKLAPTHPVNLYGNPLSVSIGYDKEGNP